MIGERSIDRPMSTIRRLALGLGAAALLGSLGALTPQPAAAAGPKVVVVVGPTHGATARYVERGKAIASQARSLGASVVEIYTPKATWSRVKSAAQGAKVLVYLGHGNGWPSPYGPFQTVTKNGLGLNPPTGAGTTSPVKYYGEKYVAAEIRLAAGAVVMLNHLCYASGDGEPGMPTPTWSVARQRVDNFAAGFIGAGASAVIADGHTNLYHELRMVLGAGSRNLVSAWSGDSEANGHTRSFSSTRRSGFVNYLDPDNANSGFFRALTTKPGFVTGAGAGAGSTTAAPTGTPLTAKASTSVVLRSRATSHGTARATLPAGTAMKTIGRFVSDGWARTWAPVRTSDGTTGYIPAWYATYTGSAVPTSNLNVRSGPSTGAGRIATVAAGSRVSVLGSKRDSGYRLWLNVKLASGRTGWMAAWFMRP